MSTPKKKQWATYLAMLVGVSMMVVCFSGCDRTPPGPVTALVAAAGDAQVVLNWTNPADGDLNGVKILRKTGSAPAAPDDGNVLFEAMGTTYTDATAVNGTEYFYAAFAFDKAGNYAAAAQSSATPTSATASENILGGLLELESEIVQDPDDVLTAEQEEALRKRVREAELLYRGGDPCAAADVLDA
ncbi:MAG TPA: hypothetical protein PLC40_20380, partial [Candidatus Hydrogenedentes bacterium]|nr:hypothetical protein [Candidatus Hydrogenedentota bacterium]